MENIKMEFILDGLCCGHCASKIENDIRALDGVVGAQAETETSQLSVELDSSVAGDIFQKIKEIVILHDEDIVLKEK